MFDNFCISDFNEEETLIYIKTLITVANSDNYFHESEKEYIRLQAEILEVDINDYLNIGEKDLSFLNSIDMSETHRIILLRDCIILSSLDGVYSKLERTSIFEIAAKLHLEESYVKMIENWRDSLFEEL